MAGEVTRVERVDRIRREVDAGRRSRGDAIDAIRAVLNVTVAGAKDLLDNPRIPSARYAEAIDAIPRQPGKTERDH